MRLNKQVDESTDKKSTLSVQSWFNLQLLVQLSNNLTRDLIKHDKAKAKNRLKEVKRISKELFEAGEE